jgi:hypothetical protein
VHTQTPFGKPAHRQWIDLMLLRQDARGEGVFVVAVEYRHRGLDNDRAVVQVGGDEMYRAAVDADTFARARVGACAGRERSATAKDGY